MRTQVSLSLFFALDLLAALATGCAGEPFRTAEPADAGGDGGGVDSPAAQLGEGARVGYAVDARGDVAAFDLDVGTISDSVSFDGPVLDLCYRSRDRRLLVVEQAPDLDAARVHAITVGPPLERAGSSPTYGGEARVWAAGEGALVVSRELGASWTLLGSDLSARSPSRLVVSPASLLPVGDGSSQRFLAVSPHAWSNGMGSDELVAVAFDGAWAVSRRAYPSREPGARMVGAPGEGSAWLVRGDGPRLELATISTAELPGSLPYRPVPVASESGGAAGVEAAVLVPSARAILAARFPSTVVVAPVDDEGRGAAIDVRARFDSGGWPSRELAVDDARGRVLVSTEAGLVAYAVTGPPREPTLVPDGAFDGSDLRAPVVVPAP